MNKERAITLLCQMYLPHFDDEEKEALTMGIEALEKQIAKKIEEHNKTCKCRVFDYMDYECTQRVPYCCVCGQKLDWSDEDD